MSKSTPIVGVLCAAFLVILSPGFTAWSKAGPPEGLRYSDLQNRTGWFANRSAPSAVPLFFGYSPSVVSPSVASPSVVMTSPSQPTVAIRGPDGVVRNYSIVGGVQQTAPGFVSMRGADGVVRSYPVVNGTAPAVSESGVITHPCPPKP
jgi:hypothetical protein